MEFYEVVKARRSIRKYQSTAVETEKLDRILEAVRLAPSAANVQPWQLFVVQSAEVKDRLKEAYSQEWFYTAPLVVVGCVDTTAAWRRTDGKVYSDVDLAIAMEHLMLAAAAEELGTCWIGAFDPSPVRRILELPPQLEPVAMTPLGYPDTTPGERELKSIEDIVTFV